MSRSTIVIEAPDTMPRRAILTPHHRVSYLDQDFYSTFLVGHLYKQFHVMQAHGPPAVQPFLKVIYGANVFFQHTDRYWPIGEIFAHSECAKTPKTANQYETAVAIFPDRDGPLHDWDTTIGFGLGAYCISFAYQIPILDIVTVVPLDDPVMYVYIVPIDLPMHEDSKPQSAQELAEFRKKHKTTIREYACRSKQRYLDHLRRVTERPMCHITLDPDGEKNIDRFRRNRHMHEKYECPVDNK